MNRMFQMKGVTKVWLIFLLFAIGGGVGFELTHVVT